MLGIGVDILYLPRVVNIISRKKADRFASRILSKQELVEWQAFGPTASTLTRARFLAVRWSVKESVYKAMYPVVRPTWKEVTYQGFSPHGHKPSIEYHPLTTEDRGRTGQIHVSVSHDGEYVYTSVLVEEPKGR